MTKENLLGGRNWRPGFPATFADDSIVSRSISLAAGTRLSSYWPTTIYQDGTGRLQEATYNYPTAGFTPLPLPVSGLPGSPLLVLPREALYSAGKSANSSSNRIFYRASNGALTVFDRDANGTNQATSGKQAGISSDASY